MPRNLHFAELTGYAAGTHGAVLLDRATALPARFLLLLVPAKLRQMLLCYKFGPSVEPASLSRPYFAGRYSTRPPIR
jgi:hypothetical protein